MEVAIQLCQRLFRKFPFLDDGFVNEETFITPIENVARGRSLSHFRTAVEEAVGGVFNKSIFFEP
ncbi:hypothetical protein PHSC3_000821 [Chlamydiales bacterium STE3]|nr:hypothetical protein PHSC3_000821 [Chlamydiales bacterium STE3]